jgi:hypothetical protein
MSRMRRKQPEWLLYGLRPPGTSGEVAPAAVPHGDAPHDADASPHLAQATDDAARPHAPPCLPG